MELFRSFLGVFGEHWWLVATLTTFGFIHRAFMKTLSPRAGYGRLLEIIHPEFSWIEKYRQILRIGLDKVEDFLSPHRKKSDKLLAKFDSESFEKFFVFALVYPILSTVYNYLKFDTGAYL